jgi:hypothetical protein
MVIPKVSLTRLCKSKDSSRPKKEDKPLSSVYIPYVKGVSEKFKRIGNRYNIRMIFRTNYTLRSSLMRNRPERDQQQTTQCVYIIPCECGRRYIGETGRILSVRLREHRHNLKEGHLEKSKLAQHAYEEGHRVDWMKPGSWKLKVTAGIGNTRNWPIWHVFNPISQPSLEISPIWIPVISNEVINSQRRSASCTDSA